MSTSTVIHVNASDCSVRLGPDPTHYWSVNTVFLLDW